jgi:hypothetical protein
MASERAKDISQLPAPRRKLQEMAAAVGIALDRDTWYKASDQELTRLILRAADGARAAKHPWDDPEKIRALEILAILAADVLYDAPSRYDGQANQIEEMAGQLGTVIATKLANDLDAALFGYIAKERLAAIQTTLPKRTEAEQDAARLEAIKAARLEVMRFMPPIDQPVAEFGKLNFSRQAFFMGDTNPSEVPRRFVGPDGLEPLEPEAPAAVPPSLTPTRRKYR